MQTPRREEEGGATDLSRRALGAWGEDRALRWYRSEGWTLLERNWRCGRTGEIDLILQRGSTIVVCEVKTRSSDAFGGPAESITAAKAARIRRMAAAWLAETGTRGDVRFDVASVLNGRIDVIEGAF